MAEAYTRFRDETAGKAPLEGMQANQMLRVRPTSTGELKNITGLEPWSFKTTPGRGILPSLAAQRARIFAPRPITAVAVGHRDRLPNTAGRGRPAVLCIGVIRGISGRLSTSVGADDDAPNGGRA